jgi:two-component system NtrC family sensor kinase
VGQGTGLGLSICFGIITKHKGRIWAENVSTGGAVFYIDLPLEPQLAKPSPTSPPASKPVIVEAPMRILAVDDELPLLNLLSRILKVKGHTVETATDGQTALHMLNGQSYDLVISDILMPDVLGPELYHQAVEQFPHLQDRFIFITGNVVDLDTRKFLEKSGLFWLSKPFLPNDLEKAVNQLAAKIQNSEPIAS